MLPHHCMEWSASACHTNTVGGCSVTQAGSLVPRLPSFIQRHRMKLGSLGTRLARVYAGWISDQCGAPHCRTKKERRFHVLERNSELQSIDAVPSHRLRSIRSCRLTLHETCVDLPSEAAKEVHNVTTNLILRAFSTLGAQQSVSLAAANKRLRHVH